MAQVKNKSFLFLLALFSFYGTVNANDVTEKILIEKAEISDFSAIISTKDGTFSVEYGAGCLSIWRYEGEYVFLARGGAFIDGIGDEIVLPDDDGSCRIWSVEELDNSPDITPNPIPGVFTDIPFNHPYAEALSNLKKWGVITGYPDGSFRPFTTINRGELMKLLVGNQLPAGNYGNCFSDVKNEWFAPYVCYGKEQGWVEGYEGNVFKPEQTVNNAEALKMAMEIYNLAVNETVLENPYPKISKDQWFAKYFQALKENKLSPGLIDIDPSSNMARGVMADILYRLMIVVQA